MPIDHVLPHDLDDLYGEGAEQAEMADSVSNNCSHHRVYFANGRLTCHQCGEDKTPLPNVRIVLVEDNYREHILKAIEKIVDGLPEDVLKDIEQHAEYLKWRRSTR